MGKRILIGILSGFLLSACSLGGRRSAPMGDGYYIPQGNSFSSNGEQIYWTATDQKGATISYSGGPDFGGMMMKNRLTCASCHGDNGQGGSHSMHMWVMDAPSIYYEALVEMMEEESAATPHADGYSLDDFRQAVVYGRHPDGDQMDDDMPRWQMNDSDLADLLAYLKTLP